MYVFFHDQELLDLTFFPPVNMPEISGIPFNSYRTFAVNMLNKFDKIILVHSELNSSQVAWFEQTGAVPVYWWSHALIAQDWFRYARLDPLLEQLHHTPAHDFLIYNRAWQGSREYRLKFAELIVKNQLVENCKMTFNPIDSKHYQQHNFTNSSFQIENFELERHFSLNTTLSTSSADYCAADYHDTRIEIVLETVFDDKRWHITEKTLRPIACGQPFIIAGTPGVLQYLRSYGFRTFSSWIDESYDLIQDPLERMHAIIDVMKTFAAMPADQKISMCNQMQETCDFNRQRFFSNEFTNHVVNEFQKNFNAAAEVMTQNQTGAYFKLLMKNLKNYPDHWPASRQELAQMWKILHQVRQKLNF